MYHEWWEISFRICIVISIFFILQFLFFFNFLTIHLFGIDFVDFFFMFTFWDLAVLRKILYRPVNIWFDKIRFNLINFKKLNFHELNLKLGQMFSLFFSLTSRSSLYMQFCRFVFYVYILGPRCPEKNIISLNEYFVWQNKI
jgi:hypothetical protein